MILPHNKIFCSKLYVTGKFSCDRKFPVTRRSFQSQKEISCHRKIFSLRERHFVYRRKSPVIEINFLSQEEISCHRKKFPVTRRYFLSQEEISCNRKNFLSQKEISCHRCPSLVYALVGGWRKIRGKVNFNTSLIPPLLKSYS